MNKKANMAALAVTVIIAVIVVGIIFGLIASQQGSTAITNDQFTASNTSCVRVTTNCLASAGWTVTNDSTTTSYTANFSRCGNQQDFFGFILTSDNLNGDTVNSSYNEISCQQITGTTSDIVGYVPLLLAVALLAFVAFFPLKLGV